MNQSGQYLLTVGLNCYKWYQNLTLGNVSERRLASRGWIVRSHISWRGEQNILYKSENLFVTYALWRYVTDQSGQYLLVVGLGLDGYKWYLN